MIPVYREFVADMETPVSVLSHFADEPDVFLLESVEGGVLSGPPPHTPLWNELGVMGNRPWDGGARPPGPSPCLWV